MFVDLVQDRIWALTPAKMDEINAFVAARLEGLDSPFKFEAKAEPNKPGFEVVEGAPFGIKGQVAVIPVVGTIIKRASLFSDWSGGVSTQKVQKQLMEALDNKKIEGIVLDIDSPGGAVDGTKGLSDFIFAARGKKPLVAVVDGTMCSAAYWIGSAADTIVASETSWVGSIGVILTHYDVHKADEQRGVVRTHIYAGRYKTMGADNQPLSKDGKDYLQSLVDATYETFLQDVARNRGVSVEQALAFADGRVFQGKGALNAGLVDAIGYTDAAIKRIAAKPRRKATMEIDEKDLKAMQDQLAKQNAEIDALKAGEAARAADLDASKRQQAELSEQLVRSGFEKRVIELVSEGKVAPQLVEAGFTDFLMSIRDAKVGEANATDWLFKNVVGAQPVVQMNTHFAEKDAAKPKDTGGDAEDREGLRIAATINKDIKLD